MELHNTFIGFPDRAAGARRLAKELTRYRGDANAIVVGLPRGGVVTAATVAEELELPLDVLVIRKLGTPGHEELAMGAIGPGGVRVLNEDVIAMCGVDQLEIQSAVARERAELERRERLYRGAEPPLDFAGRTVIVVDDGLATGSTMEAAIAVIRSHEPARIVVAVPVAPADTCERLRHSVDELVCVETPEPFIAVGCWYGRFAQVRDEEVIRILAHAHSRAAVAV